MSYLLPHLNNGWEVDQAIKTEPEKLVVIRFGHDWDPRCMEMDELIYKVGHKLSRFVTFYLTDITKVPDFNGMYELYDPMTLMFFYRNKHMMIDTGTGNNNKITFNLKEGQELIDICEVIYKGARKGKGLVVSPRDYSIRNKA